MDLLSALPKQSTPNLGQTGDIVHHDEEVVARKLIKAPLG